MRAKLKCCCFFLVVIIANAFLLHAGFRDGDYMIPVFRIGQESVKLMRTDVIKGEEGDTLTEIDSLQKLKPGQIILRRRFGNRFGFYRGFLDTAAFGKSPVLYTFSIPSWAKLSDFIQYRIYRSPTDKNGNDEDDVYFDEEYIFVKHFSKIFYYRNNTWFSIDGSPSLQLGGIEIFTDPPGARVVIDGKNTEVHTPCTFNKLLPGVYNFELVLPGYNTFQKAVRIFPGNTITAAFELLSDMDTIYISGNAPYGVLILPQPPTDSLFQIDSNKIFTLKTRLHPGKHRILWNGGTMYESVDTVFSITEGAVVYFDHIFKRRFGVLRVTASPGDAEVCIEGMPCRIGEQVMELPTDVYTISAFHQGFRNLKKTTNVSPDTIVLCEMDLTQMPDKDGDGFLDSVDQCPEKYGLFGGCPRMKVHEALKVKKEEIADYIKDDPLAIGASFMGTVVRAPTKKNFAKFMSNFSGVKIGAVNNFRGLAFLNNYHIQYRGLYSGFELGQWTAGLHYERDDTLKVTTDDTEYLIFYDSLSGIEPVMYLPSTAVTLGFHYSWSWVNIVYAIGYQWEDIVIEQVYNSKYGVFERIVMNNDWWFHQLNMEANFNVDGFIVPSVYGRVKLPFGTTDKTRWLAMSIGIQIKFVPAHWKKR